MGWSAVLLLHLLRLMLVPTMDMVLDTALLDMVTDHMDIQLMDTMEKDLPMLSQRLMPTMDTVLDTALLDMVTDHMDIQLMDIMERDLLMPSQRLCLLRIRSWIQHSWIWLQIIRIPSLWILWKEICRCLLRIRSWIQYPWIRLQIIWIPSLWCLWTCLGISYMQHSEEAQKQTIKINGAQFPKNNQKLLLV